MIKSKGVALILSVIILTAVLAIALTAGKIFTDKLKMSRNTSDSMKAYYAAESGIEYALYQIKQTPSWTPTVNCSDPNQWTEVDGAKYCLEKTGDTIKAIGKAGETRRGIEVEVASAATYSACFSMGGKEFTQGQCNINTSPACPTSWDKLIAFETYTGNDDGVSKYNCWSVCCQ